MVVDEYFYNVYTKVLFMKVFIFYILCVFFFQLLGSKGIKFNM